MSAPSRLKVFVCPECGEQCWEQDGFIPGHVHGFDAAHEFGRFVKAEEVEVIPVADLLANGGSLIEVSKLLLEGLDRKWSQPVEVAIKDGELIFRHAASENPESTEEGT